MSLEATNKNNNRKNDYPEITTHMGRLVGLVDLGHQPGYIYNNKKIESTWKIEFFYDLPSSLMEDGRPHRVSEEINQDDFEGLGLTSKMMARVRSLDPENESKDGKQLIMLLGKPCSITLTESKNGYPKIKGIPAVSSPPLGVEVPPLVNEIFSFDMEDPDMEMWEKLGKFTKEKIQRAINYPETELYRQLQLEDDM